MSSAATEPCAAENATAYEVGKREFHTVASFLSNPYEKGTREHRDWRCGWREEEERHAELCGSGAPHH
ncbi:hypothetical protein [Sinorhizobium medicae]